MMCAAQLMSPGAQELMSPGFRPEVSQLAAFLKKSMMPTATETPALWTVSVPFWPAAELAPPAGCSIQ
jgi:2-keto-3-deoxy-6-phosphogluconate aldolase